MTARPQHILIDARWIFREISGIGLYTQELIAGLVRIESPQRFTLIFNDDEVMARTAAYTGFEASDRFTARRVMQGPFSPMDAWRLPKAVRCWGIDVFHAPNYMMPLWLPSGIRRVVTMHDLIPLLFRDFSPRSRKNRLFPVYRFILHQVAAKADRIIAVSDFTRRDVVQHLLGGEAGDKITVVHEAARPGYSPSVKLAREQIEFLFVGRRDPYKNLPLLIQALARVREQGYPARLRVIGTDDPRYPEARHLSTELGVEDVVTWSGHVPDEALVQAYQQADVFVMPSNYEGFGLPVLEAMACGTPVICSNRGALPEVAGDAALLIDPHEPGQLAEAMIRLVRHPEERSALAERGLLRAGQFSWDETARQTIAVYESLA